MSTAPPVDDPGALTVEAAYELFLDARAMEYTDETLRDYETRLRQFVEWANDQGIDAIDDVTGWHLEQFRLYRQGQGLAASTMKGQMQTIKVWLEYCADIGAVDEMLPYKVQVPTPDQHELTSDVTLDADAAQAVIQHFRNARVKYASEEHVALELAWFTGARLGGLHSLDLGDYHSNEEYLQFKHRPPATVLKKKLDGERAVEIPSETCDVLDTYIEEVRVDMRDDQGRDPLLVSTQGRPTTGTIRNWIYNATIPCRHSPCPHDKHPRRCEWTERNEAHHCPSSRSPHQVRTGSITWQLNQGLTYEEVAERVNSDPDTLRRYYDKADDVERMRRRDGLVDRLDFEQSESPQDSNQRDSDSEPSDE